MERTRQKKTLRIREQRSSQPSKNKNENNKVSENLSAGGELNQQP